MELPDWWDWKLEIGPHILERVVERDFNETDLRAMLDAESNDSQPNGRFRIECTYRRRRWRIIVEPDQDRNVVAVVTAHTIDP